MHFRPQCVLCGLFTHFVGVVDAVGEDYTRMITEIGRGGACVPARVALQGRIHHSSPRTMRIFLVWKRRCADVRAGTQAPPLRFRLGGLRVGRLVSFGGIARGTADVVWLDCAWVVDFVWEDCA